MNDNLKIETELHTASANLAAGLDDVAVPAFKPTRRKTPAVAAALLLVIGGVFAATRADDAQNIRTPVAEEGDPAPETSLVDDTSEIIEPEAIFGQDATPPSADGFVTAGLLEWANDPAYGTEVRQFTTAAGTRFDVIASANRAIENADGSLVLTYHGTDGYRVTDRQSGELVRAVEVALLSEPHWHPTNPELLRYLPNPDAEGELLRLLETNVLTGSTEIITDIAGRVRNVEFDAMLWSDGHRMSTREQGGPNADGSLHAWIIDDADGQPLGVLSYDLDEQLVVGRASLRTDSGAVDYVSVSPSGDFVLVAYADATFIYDRQFGAERQLTVGNDNGDFALAADGSEAFVVIDFGPDDDAGWLLSIDLETLRRTRIFNVFEAGSTSMNISGQAFDRPGWVVVSTSDCKTEGAWTCDKVMAVEMLPDGRIVNLAHTYSCAESTWTKPLAVPSKDFTRVYFNSDSGSCNDDGAVFQLQAPPFD